MPIVNMGSVAGNFALKLDGVETGYVKSVDGGAIAADVIREAVGPTAYVKKHVGPPRYEPFTIENVLSMARSVYDWIQATLKMNYQRKNGSIVAYDYKLEARSEREFFNATITELTIPAMDGASKDPCYMTLKFAPEVTRTKKATGNATLPPDTTARQSWLPSNFRLEIPGVDCTKVSSIDSFTVKHSVAADGIGDARLPLPEPGRIEFPNLAITLAEIGADTWTDWFDDFVLEGNNGADREKTGSLVFLAPNRATELGRINLFNLGIFKLASARRDAHDES